MNRKMLGAVLSGALISGGAEAAIPLTVSQSATTAFSFAAVADTNPGASTVLINFVLHNVTFNTFTPALGILTSALDLDAVLGTGNGVSLNLTPAAGLLDAGEFRIGRLAFDPTTAGLFTRTITLQTSDADVGVGLESKALTLNLRANVIAAAVPEPASWALMIGGFGIAGGALRPRAATVPRAAA